MSLQSVALQSNAAHLDAAAPISESGLAESSGASPPSDNPSPLSEAEFWVELQARLPGLQRCARSLTRSAADAEDLVQDTVLRLCQKRELYQRGTKFGAWAMTVMKNIFLDRRRRQQRWTAPVEDVGVLEAKLYVPPAQEDSILLRELRVGLATLPTPQRAVITMIVFDGLSYEETSDRLGVPLGTVRSRLYRARVTLAQCLDLVDVVSGEQRFAATVTTPPNALLHGIHGRKRTEWSDEEEERLKQLGREGLTVNQIAARLGRKRGSVQGHMHNRKIKLRELRAEANA